MMKIPERYEVNQIPNHMAFEWCRKMHYAKRRPPCTFAFGLFRESELIGVSTYGSPANNVECRLWLPYTLLELTRLIVVPNTERNVLSYFVGNTLATLQSPCVVISYADEGQSHYGYIYQATNWVYTGVGGLGRFVLVMKDGKERHSRELGRNLTINDPNIDHVRPTTPKHRYYYFVGNKRDKRKMRSMLRFPALPYPKGEPKHYDISHTPTTQLKLI